MIDAQQETDTSTGSPVAVWKKHYQAKEELFVSAQHLSNS